MLKTLAVETIKTIARGNITQVDLTFFTKNTTIPRLAMFASLLFFRKVRQVTNIV